MRIIQIKVLMFVESRLENIPIFLCSYDVSFVSGCNTGYKYRCD